MLSFEYHEFIQPLTWSPVHTKVTKNLLENLNQVGGGGRKGGGGGGMSRSGIHGDDFLRMDSNFDIPISIVQVSSLIYSSVEISILMYLYCGNQNRPRWS